jgi:N-acetylglucosamine-6-phosphate deacetylase
MAVKQRRLGVSAALVDGALLAGDVAIADGLVSAVGLRPARGSRIAAPGFVDLQVNGCDGVDLMTADADAVRALGRALARTGVTAYLPTLITAAAAATDAALDVLADAIATPDPAGARPLGVHLEGPYLSPARLGTHPERHRRDPDAAELAGWCRRAPVAAVTLAPELPGALPLIKGLARDGVLVSLGHSDATAAQARAGFDAGARAVTHLFNAMRPLGHREPGLPGAALAAPDVTVMVIVDGYHLAADVVRLVFTAAPGRVALVTDATSAAGRPDGVYELAGVALEVRDGAVRNPAGALAGSTLTLDAAVRHTVALGIDEVTALVAATEVPARLLGRADAGRLCPGAPADVVVLDDALQVVDTLLGGTPVAS